MNDTLATIITSIVTAGPVSGLAVYFIQQRYQHTLDSKLERLKDDLKKETDVQIAQRAQIFRTTETVIIKTYQLLSELNQAVQIFTQRMEIPEDPDRKISKEVLQIKAKAFYDYYLPNKLYIPPKTAIKIEDVSKAIENLAQTFVVTEQMQRAKLRPEFIEVPSRHLSFLSKSLPDMVKELEIEFQDILGFTSKNA